MNIFFYRFASLAFITIRVDSVSDSSEKKCVVWKYNESFNPLFDLLFNPWLISARTLVEVLIVNEALDLTISSINERSKCSEDEGLVVFERNVPLDILIEVLIGIEREGIRILVLSSDLQLLKSDLAFTILALDL